MSYSCYKCGEIWTGSKKPGRHEICSRCGAYIRVCRNCQFYDPALHNQCRIPEAEYVSDKERANFCEWFVFREKGHSGEKTEQERRQEEARRRWENLFKDNS